MQNALQKFLSRLAYRPILGALKIVTKQGTSLSLTVTLSISKIRVLARHWTEQLASGTVVRDINGSGHNHQTGGIITKCPHKEKP